MEPETIYGSAADLWPALIQRAGLTGARSSRQGSYDKELIDDLKRRLFPGSPRSLETLLAGSDLSAEDLLRAFFATLRPFAEMKRDILEMLLAAQSRQSGDSLKIRFNFDPEHDPLDLLLEQFREQMEQFANAVVERPVFSIGYQELWQISRAGAEGYARELAPEGTSPGLRRWLDRYDTRAVFEPLPDDWRTGRADVDDRLGRVIDLANALLAAFCRYGSSHDELRRAGYNEQLRDQIDPTGFRVQELWFIESDFWPRAIAGWIAGRRADVVAGSEADLQTMMAEIDRLLPPPMGRAPSLELVRSLVDILALPVWRHRHEVYAVWLGALMYRAFVDGGWSVRFHLDEGRLEFAWRGVQLATLTRPDDEQILLWWTELETRHSNLPSGARTKAAKPDYRVRKLPLSDPFTDVVVVEAKQHQRSSRREFVNALMDYAFACPGAGVLLANYGPVGGDILGRLSETSRPRCSVHAFVRPDCAESLDRFLTRIGEVLDAVEGEGDLVRASGPIEVQLSWNDASDLDLHIRSLELETHVYYGRRQAPGVQHAGDVTRGPGIEKAFIEAPGRYLIAVHQYAGLTAMPATQARVTVSFGPGGSLREFAFEPPSSGSGRWWRVAIIDTAVGSVMRVGTLDDLENTS